MSKIVIADSACLIGLSKIGQLHILRQLFEKILIPSAVFHEVVVLGAGRCGAREVENAEWIEIQVADQSTGSRSMQKRILSLFLLVFAISACALDPNEQYIQGVWEISHADDDNEFFQWSFNNGTFTREQEIDRNDPLYTTGRYRVTKSDGDLLILELYDFSGSRISYENNPMTIKIEIDRVNDTLRITNILFVWAGPRQ